MTNADYRIPLFLLKESEILYTKQMPRSLNSNILGNSWLNMVNVVYYKFLEQSKKITIDLYELLEQKKRIKIYILNLLLWSTESVILFSMIVLVNTKKINS